MSTKIPEFYEVNNLQKLSTKLRACIGQTSFFVSHSGLANHEWESFTALKHLVGPILLKLLPDTTEVTIAGGVFKSILNKEKISDIDVYLLGDQKKTLEQIKLKFQDVLDKTGSVLLEDKPILRTTIPCYSTRNFSDSVEPNGEMIIYTYTISITIENSQSYKIQFINIHRKTKEDISYYFDNEAQIIYSFDFTACMMAQTFKKEHGSLIQTSSSEHINFLYSVYNKQLEFNQNNSDFRGMSLKRFYKYTHDYGFNCSEATLNTLEHMRKFTSSTEYDSVTDGETEDVF